MHLERKKVYKGQNAIFVLLLLEHVYLDFAKSAWLWENVINWFFFQHFLIELDSMFFKNNWRVYIQKKSHVKTQKCMHIYNKLKGLVFKDQKPCEYAQNYTLICYVCNITNSRFIQSFCDRSVMITRRSLRAIRYLSFECTIN